MELTYEEIERFITRVSSGKEYKYLESKADFILYTYPTNELRLIAEAIYKKEYNKAIQDGMLPAEELEKIIKDRGIFSDEDQDKVDKLTSRLEAQKVLLSKTVKVRANRERIVKVAEDLQRQIDEILHKKYSTLSLSADARAIEAKNQYLCWGCTLDVDSARIWSDYKSYLAEKDLTYRSEVLSGFLDYMSGADVATIRYVARSNAWRIRYTTSLKTSEQLFGKPTAEYTTDQLNLAYWSGFYEQVYSMMPGDRPSDEVIEDDKSLDAYMEEYYKELQNEAAIQGGFKDRTRGAMSAFDKEEVIVTKSNELYQEIEYDKPKEAQKLKDKSDIRKKAGKKRKR